MTDRFDYRDPTGHDLKLDLPSSPPPRGAAAPKVDPRPDLAFDDLPEDLLALPDELTAPFVQATPERPETEAWSLELEDIAPPVATPSLASPPPRTQSPARAAAQLRLPQPSAPQHPPPVRTLELRIAQSVDRMSPVTRVGLLTLTVVAMLLLATTVLMAGVRSALATVEEIRQAALAAERSSGTPRGPGAHGHAPGHDPYEQYRVDDLLQVDDEGRHIPPPR